MYTSSSHRDLNSESLHHWSHRPPILNNQHYIIVLSQVVDLSETPPESGLEICRLLSGHNCRVLVCGGDGTVGWVLATIDKSRLPVSAGKFCRSYGVQLGVLY